MPRRWCIIANPVSGRGKGRKRAKRVARLLGEAGVDAGLLWTAGPGQARPLAVQALERGAEGLLVCGGDGTVQEAINGLLSKTDHGRDYPLGLIPSGRCNDFRTCLRLPFDAGQIVDLVLSGGTRPVDLGRIGESYFTTVATLGFDSAVSRYVAEARMPPFLAGTPAYLFGTFVQLLRYKEIKVHLKGDGLDFEGLAFLAATGNTPNYGGRMLIAPGAVVDDGFLDLCLVRPVSRWEVLKMVPRVFKGGHVTHPAVSLHRLKALTIEAETPVWVWADGEPVAATPVTIQVAPAALSVLSPR